MTSERLEKLLKFYEASPKKMRIMLVHIIILENSTKLKLM